MAAAPGGSTRRSRRSRVRVGDIVIVLLVCVSAVLLYNYSLADIFALVYHPVPGLIALVMIAEFLWLKSGDRTRVYRLEIDKLRGQRRRDEDLLKRAREIIDQAIVYPESEEKGRPGDWQTRARDAVKDIDERM